MYNFKIRDLKRENNLRIIPPHCIRLTGSSVAVKQTQRPNDIIEPRHEKTCLSHMRTTKVQISLGIRAV